jgi:hypothetical protein
MTCADAPFVGIAHDPDWDCLHNFAGAVPLFPIAGNAVRDAPVELAGLYCGFARCAFEVVSESFNAVMMASATAASDGAGAPGCDLIAISEKSV